MFLIAENETGLVAHASASDGKPSVLTIVRLYVARREQGRGIGSALLESLDAQAPSAGLVRLNVLVGNDRALSFYERRGFRIVGSAEGDGRVSLHMGRTIPR